MIKNLVSNKKIAVILCYSTLFLKVFDFATNIEFPIYLISLFILIMFTFLKIVNDKMSIINIFKMVFSRIKNVKYIFLFLILYMLIDFITLFYSVQPLFSFSKYIVIAEMVIFIFIVLLLINTKKLFQYLYFTLFCNSIFVSLFAIFDYFVLGVYFNQYYRRLSLIPDYNKFATVLLIGLVCGFVLLLNTQLPTIKKYIIITLSTIPIFSTIYLASSRRSYLILLAVVVVLVAYIIYLDIKKHKITSKLFTSFIALIVMFGIITGATFGVLQIFTNISDSKYKNYINKTVDPSLENGTEKIVDEITKKALDKRIIIWNIAINKINSYTLTEKLFGKGFGYSFRLYDITKDKALEKAYLYKKAERVTNWLNPHNFVLTDMLDGGFFKTIPSILVWLIIAIYLFLLLRKSITSAVAPILIFGILLSNNFISSPFGFLYDKFFWILLLLIIFEFAIQKKELTD